MLGVWPEVCRQCSQYERKTTRWRAVETSYKCAFCDVPLCRHKNDCSGHTTIKNIYKKSYRKSSGSVNSVNMIVSCSLVFSPVWTMWHCDIVTVERHTMRWIAWAFTVCCGVQINTTNTKRNMCTFNQSHKLRETAVHIGQVAQAQRTPTATQDQRGWNAGLSVRTVFTIPL